MSFWDNVKKFAQPYAEDDYSEEDDYLEEDDYTEDQPAAPASRTERRRSNPFEGAAQEPATPSGFGGSPAGAASERSTSGFGGQVLNMGSGKQEVVLFHAKTYADAAKACDDLRKRKAVILNMENVDKALTRRVVDFMSGSVYALDGHVKKIAQSTYLFLPHNMDVIGDLENVPSEDSYV